MAAQSNFLGIVDGIFWRGHRGMGAPVNMQAVLIYSGQLIRSDLDDIHRQLAGGLLNKRVVANRFPLARKHFRGDALVADIRDDGVITDLAAWADHVAELPLDPAIGPSWRLAYARLDGTTVVSLTTSHVFAAGRTMMDALTPVTVTPPTVWDEARDLAHLAITVGRGMAAAATRATVSSAARRELWRNRPDYRRVRSTLTSVSSTYVSIDRQAWDRAVNTASTPSQSASSNALFITAITTVIGHDCRVTIPMSPEHQSPETTGGEVRSVTLNVSFPPRVDVIRRDTRELFTHPPATTPAGIPQELVLVVGDRIAHALTPNPGTDDVLASSVGHFPTASFAISGIEPHTVFGRAYYPQGACGTHAWMGYTDSTVTIVISSSVMDSATVADRVRSCLGGWGLDAGIFTSPLQ